VTANFAFHFHVFISFIALLRIFCPEVLEILRSRKQSGLWGLVVRHDSNVCRCLLTLHILRKTVQFSLDEDGKSTPGALGRRTLTTGTTAAVAGVIDPGHLRCVLLLLVRDYSHLWLAHFNLRAHLLNLRGLLFELGRENFHSLLLLGDY